jgi:hypothetical protein
MQRVRKVYVSSAHRVSGTTADFQIELPVGLEMPHEAHMAIVGTSIPHVFYGVSSINNKLYIDEPDVDARFRMLTLEPGNYTASSLSTSLSQKLNANPPGGITYTVSYSATTLKITILQSGGNGIRVFTDSELKTIGFTGGIPISTPSSLNSILMTPQFSGYNNAWISGPITLIRTLDMYIRSTVLSVGASTLDCGGRRNVLRKVHVDKEFGFVCVTDNDYTTSCMHHIGGRSIRSFDISLTDAYGVLIDMPQDWSFTIAFLYGELD